MPNPDENDDVLDQAVAKVRQRLRDSGPEVDYELIAGFLEGFLTEAEHKDVEQKVGTWVNWHDAYWESRSYSQFPADEKDGPGVEADGEQDTVDIPPLGIHQRFRRMTVSLLAVAATVSLLLFAANAYLRPPKSVAYLDDAFGKITKDPSGAISGLDAYPPAWREDIESMLSEESVDVPIGLLQFAAGSKGREGQSSYLTPVGTVVRSQTPTFRWTEIESALEYRVALDPKDISKSKPIATTEWTPSQPLVRGRVYSWQLTVFRNGTEFFVDEFPLPKLKVLDEASEIKLAAFEVEARGSHLVLAAVYLHFGLLDDANHELEQLVEENPTSDLARKLLGSL